MSDQRTSAPRPARLFARRQVLRAGGALVGVALVEHAVGLPALTAQGGGPADEPTRVFDLVRTDVQLRFTLELYNLDVVGDELVSTGTGRTRIVFVIGSQHVDDEVPAGRPPLSGYGPEPVRFRAATPTRLAFAVVPPMAFDLDTLLDWQELILALDGRAAADESSADRSLIDAPSPDVTTLGLLEGLTLSPIPTVGPLSGAPQARLLAPRSRFGSTSPVWQATIVGGPQPIPTAPDLRAIWSPGYQTGSTPAGVTEPFPRPLTALVRRRLVHATGDWSGAALDLYPAHEPISAATPIQLSAEGASASLAGSWTGDGALDSFVADTNLGRTVATSVVSSGRLLPFGHRALVTEITTRRFAVDSSGDVVAGLSSVQSFVVPQTTVTLQTDLQEHDGREWPLRDVTIVPPSVMPLGRGSIDAESTDRAWLVQDVDGQANVDGTPLMMTFQATDRLGTTGITFQSPVVFVDEDAAFSPGANPLASVLSWSSRPTQDDLFTLDMDGQLMGMADAPDPADVDAVTKAVSSLRLDLRPPSTGVADDDLLSAGQVGGLPHLVTAEVQDPIVDALRGLSAPQSVVLHPKWLQFGFGDDNVGRSYLSLVNRLELGYANGGEGVVTPDLIVDEYNLDLGISASLDDLISGWNPLENLQLTAELFGAVPLSWILPEQIPFGPDLADQPGLPGVKVELDPSVPPAHATLAFCWEPPLKTLSIGSTPTFVTTDDLPDSAAGFINPFGDDITQASFLITQTIAFGELPDGQEPDDGATLAIQIDNVLLQLPPIVPLIQLYMRQVLLTSTADEGEVLDVDIVEVRFTGILNFLDVIERYLGGVLEVVPPGLGATSLIVKGSVEVTDVSLGFVEIGPLTISTALTLPIADDDSPTQVEVEMADFGFTLMGFGGTGEFSVLAAPHPLGVIHLTAELAGVVEISVDALIASAYAQITFGARLDFTYPSATNSATNQVDTVTERIITIFLQIAAGLSVLGIIELSGSVELAAEYNLDEKTFTGRVTCELALDYWVGEKSKSVTFESTIDVGDALATRSRRRQIGADAPAGRVSFGDLYTEPEWLTYCGKFV